MLHILIGLAGGWPHAWHVPKWTASAAGYLASGLVLATFSMTSMLWLRSTAICSNIAFIFYATVVDIRPVLILHCILLPVNVVRLVQIRVAVATARRLLAKSDSEVRRGDLADQSFLSPAAVADPGAALPLCEREQERVVRLLIARVPSEAAIASGIGAEAAERALDVLDGIDRFLSAIATKRPAAEQLTQMASLHSRNDILRALHQGLGELAVLLGQTSADKSLDVATSIGEGLGVLLLNADEAARSRKAEDIDLLLRTTEDRSALVERIRQDSVTEIVAGSSQDYRTIYAMTALYERSVWLLHRYAALLADRPASS